MKSLLKSRKFWLAVFGVTQSILFHFMEVPDEVWQSISALVMVLIGSIAIEDAAEKSKNDSEVLLVDSTTTSTLDEK